MVRGLLSLSIPRLSFMAEQSIFPMCKNANTIRSSADTLALRLTTIAAVVDNFETGFVDKNQGHTERVNKMMCLLSANVRDCLLYPVETRLFWVLWLSFQCAALGHIFDAFHYIKRMCLRRPLRVTRALMTGS